MDCSGESTLAIVRLSPIVRLQKEFHHFFRWTKTYLPSGNTNVYVQLIRSSSLSKSMAIICDALHSRIWILLLPYLGNSRRLRHLQTRRER